MGDAADDLREQEEWAQAESFLHFRGRCDPFVCPECLSLLEEKDGTR